jgi:non-heme chloroperoxidase
LYNNLNLQAGNSVDNISDMKKAMEKAKNIDLDGYVFHYIEEGKGAPIIFVHGSIDDLRTWENQTGAFINKFRTVSYSRRHHFPNSPSSKAYTVEHHSDDLVKFIEKLGLAPANLVGSSYGAYACLHAAMKNPGLAKTLVLAEPPIIPLIVSNENNPMSILKFVLRDFSSGKSFLRFGIRALNPAKKELKRGNMTEGVRLFANGVLGEGGFENLPEEAQKKLTDNAVALREELLGPGFPDLPKEKLSRLDIPVLLVYGEKSPRFFHAISDRLYNIIPDCEKTLIRNASHDSHLGNPSLYNEKVLEFLSRFN